MNQLSENVKSREAEVDATKKRIDEFSTQVNSYKETIVSTTDLANQAVIDNRSQIEKFLSTNTTALEALTTDSQKKISNSIQTFEGSADSILDEKRQELGAMMSQLEDLKEKIEQLIGRATGASLFHTFHSRQKQLRTSVRFWYRTVLWSAVVTLIIVAALFFFVGGSDVTGDDLLKKKLSSLLIGLPAYVWLYFCIRQYIKERRYQEEYAFKSAVALTVSGYADLIKIEEKKDDHIVKSVAGVYEVPWKSDSVNDEPSTIIDATIKGLNKTLRYVRDIAKSRP